MPSLTRPGRDGSHRAAVERDVLAAVERLLAGGESFTALGIGRIADEAGIARTTFYGHFRDKPHLLMRLTESATATLFSVAGDWVRDDDSTRAELEHTVQREIEEYRAHAPLLRAVAELASYESVVEADWTQRITAFAELIAARMRRAAAAGRISPDLDPDTTAAWIAWGTERTVAMHVAAHPGDRAGDAVFARGVAAATWAALGYPPQR